MIKYALKCDEGHSFDSWFQSAAAFETLAAGGHLSCATCGSAAVNKSLMAPKVVAKIESAVGKAETTPMVAQPDGEMEQALAKLRRHVEENADYVGKDFAKQAREMHDGDTPERAIWGEVRTDQARALIKDGVPVAPLPFKPRRKMQ